MIRSVSIPFFLLAGILFISAGNSIGIIIGMTLIVLAGVIAEVFHRFLPPIILEEKIGNAVVLRVTKSIYLRSIVVDGKEVEFHRVLSPGRYTFRIVETKKD